jgi:hypothetical protein
MNSVYLIYNQGKPKMNETLKCLTAMMNINWRQTFGHKILRNITWFQRIFVLRPFFNNFYNCI